MKSAFAILTLTSLIGVAVFGFMTMNHESGHGYERCIAATARGIDCPAASGKVSLVFFHLDTFKGFSLGIVLAALALTLPFWFAKDFVYVFSEFRIDAAREAFAFSSFRDFTHWLALHENSPALA